jgi:predicted ATPase
MDKGDMQKIEFLLKSKLQNTVVGRSNEIEAIKMQFDSVLEGRSAVTIIAGDIGIGKTALVRTVLSDLSRLNAVCVYGKFEQYKDKGPYIPIIQIIEQITNHMLTLPEEKLSRIRDMLTKELGRDSALITGIVPKACRIMSGSRRIKDSDYQKLKIRLGKAFQTFISIAAKELYPLIIAVDDIQWADMASWNIIQSINEPLSEHDLYMILAYRNNLEEYRTKVKAMVDKLPSEQLLLEINLGILTSQEVKVMLGQVFGGDCDNIDELARLIHRETVGNPLYIKQMLNLLLENEGIYYNPVIEKWCLDLKKAKGVNLSDTIKDIINRKIDNLSPEAKELLEIASCIGSRFSLELLQKITKDRFECLKENLEVLKRAGLIVEIFEHPGIDDAERFEFFHDRVYQSVYEHIEPCRKEQLHFDIAIELLNHPDKVYIEEHILPITAHLLKCKSVIKREGIGNRLIMDLYFAGLKAKRSAAFEHAQKLFSLAEELLGESCWKRDYDNTLKIKLELMECQFICGEYEAAKVLFKEALSKAVSEGDLADIKKRFMVLNSYTGSPDAVIDLGIQALKHLGFSINTQILSLQIAKEMLYGKLLFRSSRLESIRNAPIVTDKRVTNALEILTMMAASANMIDEKLFALIVLKIGNLSAKYGNSLYSPLGYAAYSLILGPVMGNFKKAEELKDISLSLAELFGDDLFGTPTYFCVGSFVVHWIELLKKAYARQKNFGTLRERALEASLLVE